MSDLTRVILAPGRRLKIDPHPAGEAFGILWLEPGDSFDATPDQVGRFYAEGRILHPTTGLPRAEAKSVTGRVTINVGGRDLAEGEVVMPTREETEARTQKILDDIEKRNAVLRQAQREADNGRAKVLVTDRHGVQRDPTWPTLHDEFGEI